MIPHRLRGQFIEIDSAAFRHPEMLSQHGRYRTPWRRLTYTGRMAKIKGFAIRGLLRYLKEKKPGVTQDVLARLSPEARASFDQPIVSSGMYPYRSFAELLREIDREVGSGDLTQCEDVGDFAARQDINGIFKMMISVFSPKTIVERSGIFWSRYSDTGQMVGVRSDSSDTVLVLRDFPEIDEAHCYLMNGWIRRWALMTKATTVTVQHTVCVHHGGDLCQWEGGWT